MSQAIRQTKEYIQQLEQQGKLSTDQKGWRTRLPRFPELDFSDGVELRWQLETSQGAIVVRLLHETAPAHVANFLYLTELGYFDGLGFHRVIPRFMAQGGCPIGSGTGGPGYRFDGEFDGGARHDKPGILSMANAGPGTDGSQFFITFVATPHLDGNHTVFGEVVEGHDTLAQLERHGSPGGAPSQPLRIDKATVSAA